MQTIVLSASAVGVLRFRVKGWRFPIRDCDRDAFQELVVAGIMAPDGGGDYRFTEEGWRGARTFSAKKRNASSGSALSLPTRAISRKPP